MDKLIKQTQLDQLCEVAANSPRLRKNLNLHSDEAHPCNRLLNALQVGTYIRPHRHLGANKDETLLIVQGKLGIILFADNGDIQTTEIAQVGGPVFGYHLPRGQFHTVLALEPNTVFFEAKAGPYFPLNENEFASWAPPENTMEAAAYLSHLTHALKFPRAGLC